MNNRNELRYVYFFGLALYFIASLYTWFQFPGGFSYDLISYLQIAKLIHSGYYWESVNAYWSPLFAWCIVPFLYLKLNWFDAYRLVNILAGLAVLMIANQFLKTFSIKKKFYYPSFGLLVFFCFVTQIDMPFADFFVTPFFMGYILCLHRSIQNGYTSIWTGVMGALCFFAKGFFLIYSLSFFFLVCFGLWYSRKEDRRKIVIFFAKNTFVFLTILAVWISVLSAKYDRFIITSSASFNSNIPAPGGVQEDLIQLKKPVGEHAVSEWDDPTYRQLKMRNPFSSIGGFMVQLNIWKENAGILGYMFQYMSYLGVLVILVMVLPLRKQFHYSAYLLGVSAVLVFFFFYFLIFLLERYIIPGHFMLLVLLSFSIQYLSDQTEALIKIKGLSIAVSVILFLAIVKNPVYQFRQYLSWDHSLDRHQWNTTLKLGQASWLKGKRVASTGDNIIIVACMFANAKTYGEYEFQYPVEKVIAELKNNKIEVFCWYDKLYTISEDEKHKLNDFLKDKRQLFSDSRLGVRIFNVEE